MMEMRISQIERLAPALLASEVSVELKGPSGIGKTEVVEQVTERMAANTNKPWGFASINCSTALPITVPGFPLFSKENARGTRSTLHTEPVWMTCKNGKSVFDYEHGVLMLDEITSAEGDIKKQLADLQLTKSSGNHKLPPGWVVWATGNRVSDRSGETKDFDFLINRRLEIHVRADIEDTVDHYASKGVHPVIMAFCMQNPQIIIHDKAPEIQGPWATPRSMFLTNRVLAQFHDPAKPDQIQYSPEIMALAAGLIGDGAANQLATFIKMANSNIQFKDIVADPKHCPLPERPDIMMLTSYMAASRTDVSNIAKVIQYMERLPEEFAVLYVRSALKKQQKIINTQAMGDWCANNASLLAVVTALK